MHGHLNIAHTFKKGHLKQPKICAERKILDPYVIFSLFVFYLNIRINLKISLIAFIKKGHLLVLESQITGEWDQLRLQTTSS